MTQRLSAVIAIGGPIAFGHQAALDLRASDDCRKLATPFGSCGTYSTMKDGLSERLARQKGQSEKRPAADGQA